MLAQKSRKIATQPPRGAPPHTKTRASPKYPATVRRSAKPRGQKQYPEALCKRGVLRNFTKFTGKHLCQRLFLNKVADLVAFLWILRNFYKHFFYGAPPVVASNIFPRAIYYALFWPIFDITWKIDVIWEQNIRNQNINGKSYIIFVL